MKLVIPLRRAMSADMVKAFTRGGGGAHKYVRRQRVFIGGKLRWRYFYLDDVQRKAVSGHNDPTDQHEHHLIADLPELHPNLKGKMLAAVDATVDYIRSLFGFGGKPSQTKVVATPGWNTRHHQPFVERETEGEVTGRSPQARIAKAMELIPDHLKEIVATRIKTADGKRSSPGVSEVILTTDTEFVTAQKREAPAGMYNMGTGRMHIVSGAIGSDVGQPKFRGMLTWMEQVVVHEFGHGVHTHMMTHRPEVWESWTSMSRTDGNKISEYAGTNSFEDFAETFSCALTHPKQLADECPSRYEWMRKNVLPELKSRDDILATPDEELAWWKAKPDTPATRVLNRARNENPATRFAAYYSDKDQFYLVNKDGRQVYLRVGPPDKQSEDGWERMAATLDPETGLPRYEGGIYNRFRAADTAIKEIYDDNGNPLDDRQAWLHLGQDDEKVISFVEGLDEDPATAATKLYDKDLKAAQKGSLGREMFNALGGNLFDPSPRLKKLLAQGKITEEQIQADPKLRAEVRGTLEYERGRVERARKKGETGEVSRHDWAPVEISGREFLEKSGTFKFGEVRAAPDDKQTSRIRNESGKAITRYDPVSGKHVPLLSVRLYEQQNPDGTWSKIRVSEDSAFSVGDEILAPQKFVQAGDETFPIAVWSKKPKAERDAYPDQRTYTAWSRYRLKESDPTDPEALAREFGTTAYSLLQTNSKTGYGQLVDPVLAALLNPGGRKQIRNGADLQALMREAATAVPPRRTWVSIKGPSRHGTARSVAHIEVEWDGAGPPKVVGDYWARKLGKTSIRLDELLTAQDEIRLPRIVERKGPGRTKEKATTGATVYIQDPKTGHRIMATYVRSRTADGKTKHEVVPLSGQGAGVEKKAIVVDSVVLRELGTIPNPAKVGLRRRFVQPLESDVLVYADEVPEGSGPFDPSGVIRIMLPKDGGVSIEELRGIPGVQVDYKRDDDQHGASNVPGVPVASVSVRDIPRVRAKLGGFVMDERVRGMLDIAMQQERALRERLDEAEVVSTEDIEDEKGNINPNGVLKGLVTGDEGIQPGAHRIKALKRLARNGGRLFVAHFMGTGKSAFAIMASQMMRNLRDENGQPHPNQLQGKTLLVVPLNTAENWYQEFKKFAGAPPTLVGASTLAGAQQLPKLPARKEREADNAFTKRVLEDWRAQLEDNPSLWNPFTDGSDNVVAPFEYFRDNEEALRLTGLFDGLVVDEAHKIARENEVSRAIERWNAGMKMFIPMTGTPITNTLSTLPRLMRLVSNGEVDLSDDETFKNEYLAESAVQKAMGARNPPRTDLNPSKVGQLMALVQPYMDVANTTDVKGQSMPAVLLDENSPAHMTGQQATMYRAAMAELTESDLAALEGSAALGLDEEKMLDPDARRKVAIARSVANCPAYKAPDLREEVQYTATTYTTDPKRGVTKEKTVERAFRLPDYRSIMAGSWDNSGSLDKKKRKGFVPHWPSQQDVMDGLAQAGYVAALHKYSAHLFGVDYRELEGEPINKDTLDAIKKGTFTTDTGLQWSAKVVNPDYGPEGMISRGVLDDFTGEVGQLSYTWVDEHGAEHTEVIPTGKRFIRDPNRKAAGLFYDEEDWDFTGRFEDTAEGEDGGASGAIERLREEGWVSHPSDPKKIYLPETGDSRDKPKGWGTKARNQAPKIGREQHSIQKSTARRRERAMFDQVVTHGNAKCDAMEEWIKNVLSKSTGDPNSDLTQFILFGNRVGSSVRTVEAKLRTMGFQDVNEALGTADVSSSADKAVRPRKYFVSYMGKGATTGDRNLNSEIFRRKQDKYGKDTGVSMFVQRALYGGTKRAPKLGEIVEGWGANERKAIADNFADATGRANKDGSPKGLEMPLRVTGVENERGEIVPAYVYESELKPKDRVEIKRLEVLMRGAAGEARRKHEDAIRATLEPYWSSRIPLTDHQQHVFNNTQFMVASDAANVGLNWPAAYLGMYDSLFSPMDEWQRITRAARMLPPAVSQDAAPIVARIDAWIRQNETQQMRGITDYDQQTAIAVIQDAMDQLDTADKQKLAGMAEGSPEMLVEAYFAKRSLERIQSLREEAQSKLRREGYWPDPDARDAIQAQIRATTDPGEVKRLNAQLDGLYVPPEAIQGSDVTNYILREKLSPFERKMMKDRRFLVDVKRFTTSVDMPEWEVKKIPTPDGKTIKVRVQTGNFIVESPSQAERAQLAQQRAKMVPYEAFLNDVQNARPQTTQYDFVSSAVGSVATTSTTDKSAAELESSIDDQIHFAEELRKSLALHPRMLFKPPRRSLYYARIP